jgi:hypothetical protein
MTSVAYPQDACPNPNHDCFTPDGPGCSNTDCCIAVCAIDPFCCDTGWDGICVDEALALCSCGGVDAGDCFVADDTPACNDAACCNEVCAVDPFCCNTVWDSICADEATSLCNCPNPAHNCFTTGDPGCSDDGCCVAVCNDDPFCCESSWDGLCVSSASTLCNGCGDPDAGDCFVDNGTPFCNIRACCDEVCAIDPFCCTTSWDSVCAGEATTLCNCPNPEHDCFTTGTPGCNDDGCCQAVCAIDAFCCTDSWDSLCVTEAFQLCDGCGNANAGDCFTVHANADCNNAACCNEVCASDPFCCNDSWDNFCVAGAVQLCNCPNPEHNCFTTGTPGCSDDGCCQLVCITDDFCCTVSWDGVCVDLASELCDGCGDPEAGDCCSEHPVPFCDNRACCDAVCAIDSFCCEVEWDGVCVGEAGGFAECGCVACPVSDHNCVTEGGPGCTDEACCLTVCADDPFCCDTAWDGVCVEEANKLCTTGCGVLGTGSCFIDDGTPFCNNRDCCETVCAVDSFCCDVAWDGVCVDEALDLCCAADISPVNNPDVCGDGDGTVGAGDLGELLANWGACPGCCADLAPAGAPDGVVNAADLGELLANWGACP